MTEQLAAENVGTAPQAEELPVEEQANSEVVEAAPQEETPAIEDSFIPEEAMTPNIQKRINKLTWEKHEAERQANARIAELEAQLKGQAPQVPTETLKPKLSDYDYDDEKYSEALVDWKVEQRLAKQAPTPAPQAQPDAVAMEWASKQSAYAAEHADYVQMASTMANAIQSQAMQQYIVNSQNGPKLHHQLLNNVPELIRIQQLPEWAQGAELVKLESSMTKVKTKAPSKAPEPVKPVASGKPAAAKVKGFSGGKFFPT